MKSIPVVALLLCAALANAGPVGPIPGPRNNRSLANNLNPPTDASIQAGRKYFIAFNCSGCHGGRAGGGMGPSLRDDVWIYGGEPEDIFDSISQGRAHGMPAWGTMLPPQLIWRLVDYIKSMRTPQEPEAPQ
jgi:cytochrome c oxidase cbb3-type subunit 3